MRQDRAVFRFEGEQPTVEVTLPQGVEPDRVSTLLDGKPIRPQWTTEGSLIVGRIINLLGDSIIINMNMMDPTAL